MTKTPVPRDNYRSFLRRHKLEHSVNLLRYEIHTARSWLRHMGFYYEVSRRYFTSFDEV